MTAISLLACRCDDYNQDVIYDYSPFHLFIVVNDEQGCNLLDPEMKNNVVTYITLQYDGKDYQVEDWQGNKAILAKWYGLRLLNNANREDAISDSTSTSRIPSEAYNNSINGYYLSFGEFDGGHNYNMEILVKWLDGEEDVIGYTRKVDGMKVKQQWTLNGEKTGDVITITKKLL